MTTLKPPARSETPRPGATLLGYWRGAGASTWRALLHFWREMGRAKMSFLASGLAFYGLLAIFPALAVVITSFALLANPEYVQWLMSGLQGIMPGEASKLIADELRSLVENSGTKVGAGLVLSLAIAMWSARSASASVMDALNHIYRCEDERSILEYQAFAFAFTIGGLLVGILGLAAVAVIPAALSWLPLSPELSAVLSFIRWPVLAAFVLAAHVATYRFAPSRHGARWMPIAIGAGTATLLWLGGSALFSLYVARFGSYDKTYGSIGAVIVLLMWFYVGAYATLLGALLDAEIGRLAQRRRRSARGRISLP
jgi:membrane protein